MDLLHKLPIRGKLTLIIFISNVILLSLVFAVTISRDIATLKQNAMETAHSQINVLSQDFTKILLFDSPHIASDTVSRLRATHAIQNVYLYNQDGLPIFSFTRHPELAIPAPELRDDNSYFADDYLHIFERVEYENQYFGAVYYRVATDLLNENVSNNIRTLLWFFAAVIGLSLLVSWLFQRFFSQPIITLAELLNAVAKDRDFSVRADTAERNEIGTLYQNFNRMLEEIRHYHDSLSVKNQELEKHRNHLEELVQQRTSELKNYTDELEAFSYSVSHDLRTPLRAINGFSSALLEDNAAHLTEEGKQHLNRIRAASKRMGELIDDLLTLSHITQQELAKHPIDFSAVCEKAKERLLANAHSHALPMITITPNMRLIADENLMLIVMENLLGNSIKYSQYNVRAQIIVRMEHTDKATIVSVKDNGIGFNTKFSNKLFKPFERLHDAKKFEGTGVGLAIVRRIIARHDGHVWANGKENAGATFYFSLPPTSANIANSDIAEPERVTN